MFSFSFLFLISPKGAGWAEAEPTGSAGEIAGGGGNNPPRVSAGGGVRRALNESARLSSITFPACVCECVCVYTWPIQPLLADSVPAQPSLPSDSAGEEAPSRGKTLKKKKKNLRLSCKFRVCSCDVPPPCRTSSAVLSPGENRRLQQAAVIGRRLRRNLCREAFPFAISLLFLPPPLGLLLSASLSASPDPN